MLIETAVATLQEEFNETGIASERVITLSAGIVSSEPGKLANLEELYKAADRALYDEKQQRPAQTTNPLARTGTWQL